METTPAIQDYLGAIYDLAGSDKPVIGARLARHMHISAPSITEASISCVPAAVKTLPRPALNNGSSSSAATALVAASRALPPAARTSRPVTKERRKPS